MKTKKILTRKEAKTQNLPRYYTGKPCARGHIAERKTAAGTCVECESYYDRKYKRSAKGRQYAKRRRQEIQGTERAKLWARKEYLKRTYDLSIEEYDALRASQNNCCKICLISFDETMPQVDHCHDTGAIRGMLCKSCNQMLGFARDNVKVLQEAITYLS